jgi:hypothetical protein
MKDSALSELLCHVWLHNSSNGRLQDIALWLHFLRGELQPNTS